MGRRRWTAIGCVVALAVGAVALLGGGALASSSAASPRLVTVVAWPLEPRRRRPGARRAEPLLRRRAGGHDPHRREGPLRATPFLDIRSRVVAGGEQGLLGLAFPKNYAKTRTFYVNYTATGSGATVIDRYRVRSGRALPASRQQLLTVPQPYANHNGGHLAFGPDGKLWVGLGDGGSGGDPENRAQDRSTPARQDVPPRRGEARRRAPSSSPSACGTRGGTPSTGAPATSGSATSARTRSKRSASCRRPFGGSSTSAGTSTRAVRASRTRSSGRAGSSSRSRSTPTRPAARSRAATSTAGRAVASLRNRYVYGDYCSGTIWSIPLARRRAAGRAGAGREPRLVRRGPQGRALRDLARRHDLPLPLARPVSDFSRTPASPATPLGGAPAATARARRRRPRSASR